MKKFIKKNISVILSVALILGMMLPAFSGVVANAYTAENTVIKNNIDTACDNLIAEWIKLDSSVKGLDKLSPYELFTEASALDLTDFEGTDAFSAALQNLATLFVNSFDPTELKTAWGNLYSVISGDFFTPYGVTGEKMDNTQADYLADATFLKEGNAGVTIGAVSEEDKHLFGVKTATFDFATNIDRTSVDGDNKYTLFLSNDPESIEDDQLSANFGAMKKLYSIDDLQFSFVVNEINTAATGAKMGFRVTGTFNGAYGVRPTSYFIDINESMVGEVVTVKFSDLANSIAGFSGWREKFSGTDYIARIELQLIDSDANNNPDINMTIGSVVALNYNDVPTSEESANWNVSDWVYAAKSVDTKAAYNVEPFETAIKNAEELKEISGVEIGSTVSSYNNVVDLNITKENLLAGSNPTVNYYDGVSDKKEECFTSQYKKLTDSGFDKSVSIKTGNFKNDGAFLELIYDLDKNISIEGMVVSSDYQTSLRNYKYKIYMAEKEGDLFTENSLVFTYINRDNSWIQYFDFSNSPELIAKYIAVRVYAPVYDMSTFDGYVRFAEVGVYGEQRDYEVAASEFSADNIKSLGRNILAENTSKPFVRADTGNRQRFNGLFDENEYPITQLYDADEATGVAIGGNYRMYYDGDTTSLHIYYDLGKTYSIDKFLFGSYSGYINEIGKYKIHASNDLNKLFNGKSVIVDYDNTVDTTRMQIFTMKNSVAARYVSFEVTLPLANYKAWVARNGIASEGAGIRISELGVYGNEYIKDNEKENLLSHIAVDINRLDASGNRTAVNETDYSGENHMLTYDGDYDTFATVTSEGENKTIEYSYNLYQNAPLDSIRFVSAANNISSVKFYASSSKTAVFDESALVYSSTALGETEFSKYFVDAPLMASYLRVVATVTSGNLDVAEIEANGYNRRKATYENIVLNRDDYLDLYLEDSANKRTLVHENMDKWIPAGSSNTEYQVVENAFDGDLGTIYTYYGGVNNDTSVNMFLNLRTKNCVDNISVYTSVLEDYRPSKMNIYIGNSYDEVFAADATPIKAWTEKVLNNNETYVPEEDEGEGDSDGEDIIDGGIIDDDISIDFDTGIGDGEIVGDATVSTEKTPAQLGLYDANITPTEISCVRIEIVEANPQYFSHINKVGGIISEVEVNGFAATGNAQNNVVESTKDMVMRALDPTTALDNASDTVANKVTDGIEGEPAYTVNGVGDTIADSVCDDQMGYIEFAQTNALANTVTLADIDDIYFSYKVKKAIRSGNIAARIYIYNSTNNGHNFAYYGNPATATVLYVDTSNTEWVHTSMTKQFGEDWKEWLVEAHSVTAEELTISKIHFSWNNVSGAADMLFTGMYYTFNEGANPYYEAVGGTLGDSEQQIALRMSKYYNSNGSSTTPTFINSGKSNEYVDISSVGGDIGSSSCASDVGTIRFAATTAGSAVTLAEIDDIYFSYKVNTVKMGENAVARIYIYDQNGVLASTFATTGTSTVFYFPFIHNDWTTISLRSVAGNNWKTNLLDSFNTATGTERTAEQIKISEIRLGFNYTGEADMSFGNIFYQYTDSNVGTMSNAIATSILNNARNNIDISSVAKKTAKEFKYSVQYLADTLNKEKSEAKYISGDYNKTAADMKELALMAQYLDKTLGADDFMDPYCADINGDGVIDEADLIELRKQLLGIAN